MDDSRFILDIETGNKHYYFEPKEAVESIKKIAKDDNCEINEVLESVQIFGENMQTVSWIVNKTLNDCDREKLKEGFEESFSPSYANGFATALILLGVDKDEIEYITGKSIEYWKG